MNANGAVRSSRILGWSLRWSVLAALMPASSRDLQAQSAYAALVFSFADAARRLGALLGKPTLRKPIWTMAGALLSLGLAAAGAPSAAAQGVTLASSETTVGSGFSYTGTVALDASGNLYVGNGSQVVEIEAVNGVIPANNPTIRVLASGFIIPAGMAVDGSGNVYVSDSEGPYVKELVAVDGVIPANPTIRVLNGVVGAGSIPAGLAVDGSGDLYIADMGLNEVEEVVAVNGAIPANPTVRVLGGGFNAPSGVAVDGSGNVYVADSSDQEVKEILAVGGVIPTSNPTIKVLGSGFNRPYALSLDAGGNVYVADFSRNLVKEILAVNGAIPSNPTIKFLGGGFAQPSGLAVDAKGDVYVADTDNRRVVELQTQSVNLGSANVCPYGQTTPAPCSNTLTLTYNVAANTTVGAIKVLTQGAASLDFQPQSPDTSTALCAAHTYNSATTCTVDVTFAPLAPGQREGAVQIYDQSNNLLASAPIYGIGTGPQVTFNAAGTGLLALGGGLVAPTGLAVDASGNIYVADGIAVLKMPAGCASASCVATLAGGFQELQDVAVDGGGNVYVADFDGSDVEEIPLGCASPSCVATLGGGFQELAGMAVDGMGNVYVTEFNGSVVERIPAGCASAGCVATLGGGLSNPTGVAVDGIGNVYVADSGNDAVKAMPAGCASSSCVTTLGGGFGQPKGVSVDAAGDVYVADEGGAAVKVIPPGCASSSCVTTLGSGFTYPNDVAVDGMGNLYVTEINLATVTEIALATPPSLTFAATNTETTSADSPQSVTVENIGNAPLTASALVFSDSADFAQVFGATSLEDCSGSVSLAPGAECDLSVAFTPQTSGTITSAVTLTDNALNAAAAMQSVPLSGTGLQQTPGIRVLPATLNYGDAEGFIAFISFNGAIAPSGAVTFTVDNGIAVAGSCVPTVTPIQCVAQYPTTIDAGTHTIYVSIAASPGFAASAGTGTLTVNPIAPSIAFMVPSHTYGDAPFMLSATSNSTAPIAYSVVSGRASVANSTLTITGAGMVTVQASQAAAGNYTAGAQSATFTVAAATPVITWPAPAAIVSGTPLSGAQLDATASFGGAPLAGTFLYSPGLNSVLGPGTQTLSVSFTPADTTDFTSANASVQISVSAATVSVSISSTTETYQAWTKFVIGPVYSGSRVPTGTVTLYDNGAALATLTLGGDGKAYYTAGPFNVGANVITASYSGNPYFPAGLSAPATITVLPAPVNLQASCWGAQVYGSAYQCSVNLSASTSTPPGGAITYSFDGGAAVSVPIVNGSAPFTVPGIPNAGSHSLTLNYAAQGNFAAAKQLNESFTTQAGQTELQASPSSYYLAAGSSLTISGTAITPTSGIPPGTVTVYDNGAAIGTANIGAGGAFSFPVANIAKGSHSYRVGYAGSSNYSAATSASSSVTAH